MISTAVLFRIADAAEEEGKLALARQSFERGASLGDDACLCRLAYLFDVGKGVPVDKDRAMQLYRRAWRKSRSAVAGSNIAILYREKSNFRATFQWWKRVAEEDDGSAYLELAKCYLTGVGVRANQQAALRALAIAVGSYFITEAEREEAEALLTKLRPCVV